MVQITDIARDKIREILDKNIGKKLRLYIQGIGWGGPTVGLALDEPEEDEESMNINGIDVLISEPVLPHVNGAVIDYVRQSNSEGFVLKGRNNC